MNVASLALLLMITSSAWQEGHLGGSQDSNTQASTRPASRPGRRVAYAPGVVIDWSWSQVELSGTVVLREGMLELVACGRGTREHESIIAVDARPIHVYQALGLVGAEPGRPATYDEKHDRWLLPAGQALEIRVQWTHEGKRRTAGLWDWLVDAETGKKPAERPWIFCGSLSFPDGTFGADADGTVICVVDFDTTLIGLSELHSSDDSQLWLAARTNAIPARGTVCTLMIRPIGATHLVYPCDADGRLGIEGQWIEPSAFLARLGNQTASHGPLKVIVRPLPGVDAATLKRTTEVLRGLGLDVTTADSKMPPTRSPGLDEANSIDG